jgi:hypothetical protein
MKPNRCLFVLAMFVFSPSLFAESEKPNLKGGSWLIGIQMVVPNATGPSTGPVQYQRCLSPENAQETMLTLPRGTPCVLDNKSMTRDKLSWQFTCEQRGMKTKINGNIFFRNDTLSGEILSATQGENNIKITTKLSARYLGECVKVASPEKPVNKKNLPAYSE